MGDNGTDELQSQLPQDLIIHQILPRLPINQLAQCKLISKEWNSSISDPNYILGSISSFPVEKLFIQSGNIYYLCSFYHDDHLVSTLNCGIDEDDNLKLVGCSNGLVCLGEIYGEYFFLLNPATEIFHKYRLQDYGFLNTSTEHPPLQRCIWGFGYVSSANDHKVVRIMYDTVHIFSHTDNSWKHIDLGIERGILEGRAKLVEETLYWVLSCESGESKKIVSFDLVLERFDIFPDMVIDMAKKDVLCVIGGCLSKCSSNDQNDFKLDIVRSPGKVVSVRPSCDLGTCFDEFMGFTKTFKVLVANTMRGKLTLFGQNLPQAEISFEEGFLIERYVPSEISPLPSA